jgi:hypothetical protein
LLFYLGLAEVQRQHGERGDLGRAVEGERGRSLKHVGLLAGLHRRLKAGALDGRGRLAGHGRRR